MGLDKDKKQEERQRQRDQRDEGQNEQDRRLAVVGAAREKPSRFDVVLATFEPVLRKRLNEGRVEHALALCLERVGLEDVEEDERQGLDLALTEALAAHWKVVDDHDENSTAPRRAVEDANIVEIVKLLDVIRTTDAAAETALMVGCEAPVLLHEKIVEKEMAEVDVLLRSFETQVNLVKGSRADQLEDFVRGVCSEAEGGKIIRVTGRPWGQSLEEQKDQLWSSLTVQMADLRTRKAFLAMTLRRLRRHTAARREAEAEAAARAAAKEMIKAEAAAEAAARELIEAEEAAAAAGQGKKKRPKKKKKGKGGEKEEQGEEDEASPESAQPSSQPRPEEGPPTESKEETQPPQQPPPPPTLPPSQQPVTQKDDESNEARCSLADYLTCPISLVLMTDPVMADDGNTYQRHAIQAWLDRCTAEGKPTTSPLTGLALQSTELKANHLVRSLVKDRMRAAAANA